MDVTSVVIYLAIVLAGYVVVSIADSFAAIEISTRLKISEAKAIFTQVITLFSFPFGGTWNILSWIFYFLCIHSSKLHDVKTTNVWNFMLFFHFQMSILLLRISLQLKALYLCIFHKDMAEFSKMTCLRVIPLITPMIKNESLVELSFPLFFLLIYKFYSFYEIVA